MSVLDLEVYQSAGARPVDRHWGKDAIHLRGGPGQGRGHQGLTLRHGGVHAPGTG